MAVWREGLLAQAVLAGETRGYRNHPQLVRFKNTEQPGKCIATYLESILAEASARGYRFNRQKIRQSTGVDTLTVTDGQLRHEWCHLEGKLESRAPGWLSRFDSVGIPEAHPLFETVAGPVAEWEMVTA